MNKMNPMNKAWSFLKGGPDRAVMPFDVGPSSDKSRKHRDPIATVGGTEADIRQGLSGDALSPISEDTSAMDALASGTRQDLINMLLAKVQEMSDADILNLLQMTEGRLIDTLGEPNMPPPSTMEPFRPKIRDMR